VTNVRIRARERMGIGAFPRGKYFGAIFGGATERRGELLEWSEG
jgi:hypothetical protein